MNCLVGSVVIGAEFGRENRGGSIPATAIGRGLKSRDVRTDHRTRFNWRKKKKEICMGRLGRRWYPHSFSNHILDLILIQFYPFFDLTTQHKTNPFSLFSHSPLFTTHHLKVFKYSIFYSPFLPYNFVSYFFNSYFILIHSPKLGFQISIFFPIHSYFLGLKFHPFDS
jgi:hypothetical protein